MYITIVSQAVTTIISKYVFSLQILQQFSIEYHHEPIGQVTRLISMPDKPLRFSFVDRS